MSSEVRPRQASHIDRYVAQQLRRRRDDVSLTQQELAGALGVSFQQLQKYERGTNRITASRLYDLAHALNVSIDYFFEGVGSSSTTGLEPTSETGPGCVAVPYSRPPKKEEILQAFSGIRSPERQHKLLELIRSLEDKT